jgi:hypothetical protein
MPRFQARTLDLCLLVPPLLPHLSFPSPPQLPPFALQQILRSPSFTNPQNLNFSIILSLHNPTMMMDVDRQNKAPAGSPTFTLFDRLPVEIRLQIWEAALPGPRIIHLEKWQGLFDRSLTFSVLEISSNTKAPSMLLATRESRLVASQFYIPSFAFEGSTTKTYFNFHMDTLYFRLDTLDELHELDPAVKDVESVYDTEQIYRVRNLTFFSQGPDHYGATHCAQCLGCFTNIQKLTIVVGHFARENDDKGDIMFIEPIDVFETFRNYENFALQPEKLHKELEVFLPVILVSIAKLETSLDDVRQQKWERIEQENEDRGDVPMPQIEYKSAVTSRLKKYLDGLRAGYQQRLQKGDQSCLPSHGLIVTGKVELDYMILKE